MEDNYHFPSLPPSLPDKGKAALYPRYFLKTKAALCPPNLKGGREEGREEEKNGREGREEE